MYTDSHCHLNFPELMSELDSIQQAMLAAQVTRAMVICTTMEKFDEVHGLAMANDNMWATVGVHPDNEGVREPSLQDLLDGAARPKVVAIGETGLDYFYAKEQREWQQRYFIAHIQAARETGLPLVIHTRGAKDDTLALLREYGQGQVHGVLHCFTEDLDMAQQAIDMGFYISISGIITFRNAESLRDTVKALPLERLLIETDSPWLAPVPFRGKPNEPRYVAQVAECVAELKGVDVAELARITRDNFFTLFNKAQP